MSLNVKEVRKANKEYYNSTYILKIDRRVWGLFAIAILISLQYIIFKIREGMLEKIYYLEAKKQFLNGVEVLDWVNQKVSAVNFHDSAIAVIFTASAALFFIISRYYFGKGYNNYNKKGRYLIIIIVIYLSEMFAVIRYYGNAYKNYSENFLPESILYIILFLAEILSQSLVMPLDMKVPIKTDHFIFKLLLFLNKKVTEEVLDRL